MNKTNLRRVLIVDDDSSLCRLLSRFFTFLRWEVQTAPTAAAALEVFCPGKFAAIVSDVDLGHGVDGVALAQRLRQMDPDATIIMASGNPNNLDRARQAGFRWCLSKPFTLEEFKAAIEGTSDASLRKAARSRS